MPVPNEYGMISSRNGFLSFSLCQLEIPRQLIVGMRENAVLVNEPVHCKRSIIRLEVNPT